MWKTCFRAHKQHKYPYASFVCKFIPILPFRIVSVAVWITVFARFCRCLNHSFLSLFGSLFSLVSVAVWIYFNRLQNTAALELNYFVFHTFYLLPFLASLSRPQWTFDLFDLWLDKQFGKKTVRYKITNSFGTAL